MQVSPIHYCDTKSTVIRISSFEESGCSSSGMHQQYYHPENSQTLNPSSACKNSKIRRSEYSNKGTRHGSNPSQDSAFGSISTDGELSRASSFKLSSFQSMSSPIDEGVEDILECNLNNEITLSTVANSLKYIDSCCSSPSNSQHSRELEVAGTSTSVSPKNKFKYQPCNIKETCIYLEPPPEDQLSSDKLIYTSSPIRKCSTTTEVFSQKYRVSSFEDMSYNSMKNINRLGATKKAFRSFEEEQQRIETAFTPIKTTMLTARASNLKTEKIESDDQIKGEVKSPTSLSTSISKLMSGKERNFMWKSSFFKSNKNHLTIKSNESLYEAGLASDQKSDESEATEQEELLCRNNSTSEISNSDDVKMVDYRFSLTPEPIPHNSRKARSERFLFNLAKFKQNAVNDNIALENLSESSSDISKQLNSSSSNESKIENTTTLSTDDTNSDEETSSCTENLFTDGKSPSHDVKQFIKIMGADERAPLLDGNDSNEMELTSPANEPEDEML